MPNPRKALRIDKKVSLIRAIENGEKKSDVSKRFGFSPSTVSTIWKNKEKILQAEIDRKSSKKLRKPKFEDLDQSMYVWVCKQHENNMPISGPIIKANAVKLAKQLSINDFKASEGWLGKFKKRHRINFGKDNEEAQDIDTYITQDWIKKEDIIDPVRKKAEEEDDKENEADDLEPPPSIEQALRAAKLLETYIFFNDEDPVLYQDINKIRRKIQLEYWKSKK